MISPPAKVAKGDGDREPDDPLWQTGGMPQLTIILSLILLVIVHELGHFIAARRVGILATKFYVFFPPAVWKRQVGDVEVRKQVPGTEGAQEEVVTDAGKDQSEVADQSRVGHRRRGDDPAEFQREGIGEEVDDDPGG